MKQFVLDTNILIESPDAIWGFDDNVVCITQKTLEELDGLKKVPGDTGFNARRAIRNINSLKEVNGSYALFPFFVQELMDKNGHFYGLNAVTQNMIIYNRRDSVLPNGLIVGQSGRGKSYFAKGEITPNLLDTEDDIIIMDPDGEYVEIAKRFGGEVIKLAQKAEYHINPLDMDINYAASNNDDPVAMKSDYLVSLCETVTRKTGGLTPYEVNTIQKATAIIYEDYMKHMEEVIKNDPTKTIDLDASPNLVTFYDALYSDETYANAVEQHKTKKSSITASPVEMLQLSETQLFDSTKEDTQKFEKTEAHTHLLSIDEKAPTCTEDGYYRVTCSVCGEVLADHVCKRRGHNMYMVDPEDNTANIICPVFKCNRCDYTESTDHTHNWIAKGYENMTYPDGGDAVYVCATCLNKKTDHCDAVPGMYDEAGALMYTYNELEEQFNWNLSTTPAKTLMDDHTELANGSILLLPSWKYLSKVAEDSGADCGLIKTGSPACFQNSTLSKVILPDDCNDFGNWFCASNVTELELPDSITSYGRYSISSAPKLKYLKLSAGVTDLTGLSVQGNPALETLVIPEGVEKLGNTTFAGNDKLKNVTLPSTLTDIGRNVFASTGVEYLEIPAGVKEIGNSNHSLAGMSKLKTLVLNDGLKKIDSYSFSSLGALENVYIPKSVTEMGRSIFSGLGNLKAVTFQEGLTVIGDNLFQGCANLRKIIIPNSIKNIPDNLFTGAANLNLIILPEELDSIGGDGLFSCGQNSDELKIIMPTTLKEWRVGAALCSPKLKEIVLPGDVDYPTGLINNGCGLTKVVITSEPNSIALGAFGFLHDADIYYYGSQESVQKFNTDAGGKDVFFLNDNNNRLHYMIGEPPSREDQMNGINYDSLEEISVQQNLSSNDEIVVLNEAEQTESDFTKSVSDGNAE